MHDPKKSGYQKSENFDLLNKNFVLLDLEGGSTTITISTSDHEAYEIERTTKKQRWRWEKKVLVIHYFLM